MNTKSEYIETPGYRGDTEIIVCARIAQHPQAVIAVELLRHLAIMCGDVDGEDSAGRQKVRLMTPQEVAARACNIAAAAFAEFERRDWLLEIPLPQPPNLKNEL